MDTTEQGRRQLVEQCDGLLKEHDVGLLADADPEMVRLAGVVVEAGRRGAVGHSTTPEFRDRVTRATAAFSRHRATGEGEGEGEELWAELMAMKSQAEAEIDKAAAELARLAQE